MIEYGFYNCKDIQNLLGISQRGAYKIIQKLNKNISEAGYITLKGKVIARYFNEQYKDRLQGVK